MTAVEVIFPNVGALPALSIDAVPRANDKAGRTIKVIETVGVEVLRSPSGTADDSQSPANHPDVIPFASTLRRVG